MAQAATKQSVVSPSLTEFLNNSDITKEMKQEVLARLEKQRKDADERMIESLKRNLAKKAKKVQVSQLTQAKEEEINSITLKIKESRDLRTTLRAELRALKKEARASAKSE